MVNVNLKASLFTNYLKNDSNEITIKYDIRSEENDDVFSARQRTWFKT